MKLKVNRKNIEVFEGAEVRHAILSYFAQKGMDVGLVVPTELFPQKLRFCGFSSRLGKTNKFDFALAAPKSPLSKRRCKNTAFFNTVNVFFKKFYINYNLLIFNKKLPSFRL